MGKIVAYYNNQFFTIRHCSCEWFLPVTFARATKGAIYTAEWMSTAVNICN